MSITPKEFVLRARKLDEFALNIISASMYLDKFGPTDFDSETRAKLTGMQQSLLTVYNQFTDISSAILNYSKEQAVTNKFNDILAERQQWDNDETISSTTKSSLELMVNDNPTLLDFPTDTKRQRMEKIMRRCNNVKGYFDSCCKLYIYTPYTDYQNTSTTLLTAILHVAETMRSYASRVVNSMHETMDYCYKGECDDKTIDQQLIKFYCEEKALYTMHSVLISLYEIDQINKIINEE